MKKVFFSLIGFLLIGLTVTAQQQGKVLYDRTVKLQINFAGMPGGMEQQIPQSRKDKFELSYGNNQTLWKQAEQQESQEGAAFGGDSGGMQIRMFTPGSNDILFTHLESGKKTEQKELGDKKVIIDDTITKMKWKMTGETKSILSHNCMKATTTRIGKRLMMSMENGVMERKEIDDTSKIIAWFATDIPISAGPSQFQGQLPGLILEMDIKDGTQLYKATAISDKIDMAEIKEPTGKKHYTPEQFKIESDKLQKQMQESMPGGPGGGGHQVIIRSN